jgi:hypothetical protein
MPGIGEEIEGAMQQAPQPGRQDREGILRQRMTKRQTAHSTGIPAPGRRFGTIRPHHLVECGFSNPPYRVDK